MSELYGTRQMANPFGGLKIIVSAAAYRDADRARTYPKRKARTPAHWRRMDKKWRKRYGYKREPCMYRVGDTVIAHPALYAQLRQSLSTPPSESQ